MIKTKSASKIYFLLLTFIALTAVFTNLVHPTPISAQDEQTYTIRRGDTLFSIARRHNTTADQLATLNHITNPNLIFVNQQLRLPSAASTPITTSANGVPHIHIVQRGENLMRIAIKYNTSITEIADLNNLPNWHLIYVGQSLQIPHTGAVPATPPPPVPTSTPIPQAATPTAIPQPTTNSNNLLINGSFENGWYHIDNIPELQVPNNWQFTWQEGQTGYGDNVWDVWIRPETRVLPASQLPPTEQSLFIYDGHYTVKIFKGNGAINSKLSTTAELNPGTYTFTINVFPDLVESYQGGQKVWAHDPVSGEVRLTAGESSSGWIYPQFGTRNTLSHTFTLSQRETITLSLELRGRFALQNNGWFIDHATLQGQS